MENERNEIKSLVCEAMNAGARQSKACETIGMDARTIQRWDKAKNKADGRLTAKHSPKNKLTELERCRILKVANEARFASRPPNQIVPLLANEGIYIASESTFYRVLKAEGQLNHRDKAKPARKVAQPKALSATEPNQLYSWDITYLPTTVRGVFLYLYLVMDIYSRKIVGWQIHEAECSTLAGELLTDICMREGVEKGRVTLHSDNGSPMKGATMLATLQKLGVATSFSRPSVSNDNPYSESVFRTLKYRPNYPNTPFESISDARLWVEGFEDWYNNQHLHSSIRYVTPAQRHSGEDKTILKKRHQLYIDARSKMPERWSSNTRNWEQISVVHLNPEKIDKAA